MASVHDTAKYILSRESSMTAMKLQKLVYYCQAWHMVWEDAPLFPESIQAWANGPVCPELYRAHKGKFIVDDWPHGNESNLSVKEAETVDAILKSYGQKSAFFLSELTHMEDPWRKARTGLSPVERGNRDITHASMREYYEGLEDQGTPV